MKIKATVPCYSILVIFFVYKFQQCLSLPQIVSTRTVSEETKQSSIEAKETTTTSNIQHIFNNESTTEENNKVSSTAQPTPSAQISYVTKKPLKPECEANVTDWDELTQDQFISILTRSCVYDKLIMPPGKLPLIVTVQADLTHIEAVEQLKFQSHMLIQYSYRDYRLKFPEESKQRQIILGQELLRNKIWVPHVIIKNERDTSIMGTDDKDIFISISPDGEVVYSYRMTVTFYCWMNLQKFPFDSQLCNIVWSSWAYNVSNLVLQWDRKNPVKIAQQLHLTEFTITEASTEEEESEAPFQNGGFVGSFSTLIIKLKLSRQTGYYILDYFLPSILLVMISWVSFWLQADASPPRVVLGTSTMLSFITLSGNLTRNLPKVSYIKASEVWFLCCVCFIFLSMAEFAFVNVIWRRKKKVELRKQTSKYILKGALTPSLARKELRKAESESSLHKSNSSSSLDNPTHHQNYLTVHSVSAVNIPTITTSRQEEMVPNETSIPVPDNFGRNQSLPVTWTSMTPHEVANWIDKKARIVFPVAFLIFNIFYWSFVYVGNFSTVRFTFKLSRQVGFYILDYFLPSILLVITSWVTFWLQADATPPRATLGTSTMLAFITLSGNLTKNLPKVSYIKASEIWFLGCACFIFSSLAEFAFVNVIWRRRKKVELKKATSKHILKGAITPSLARKHLAESLNSVNSLYKSRSCSSLEATNNINNKSISENNYLTVHSFPTSEKLPSITANDQNIHSSDSVTTIPIPEENSTPAPTWHTMTPQEVAIWIDKKSRIAFPVAFLIFNILYWTFVYAVD